MLHNSEYLKLSRPDIFTKIDTDKIGIFGHSQGGVGVFNAITNYKNSSKIKSAIALSPTNPELAKTLGWDYDVKNVSIPIFIVAGTGKMDAETITPLATMEKIFTEIPENNLTIMGRLKDIDHGDVQIKASAYIVAWFDWTLKKDEIGKKIFV